VSEFVYNPEDVARAALEAEAKTPTPPSSPREDNDEAETPPQNILIPKPLPLEQFVDQKAVYYMQLVRKFREVSELEKEEEIKDFFGTILEANRDDIDINGPEEYKRLTTTENGCKKFFELLDANLLPRDIIKYLLLIKRKLVTQEWNDADQAYFSLSTSGFRWPWPKNTITNLMDEEDQREVLQAIKRLMTFWQMRIGQKFYSVEQLQTLHAKRKKAKH